MQKTLLELVNEFLAEKNRGSVGPKDTLYSSGLLDSMDMCELMLFLNSKGARVDPKLDGSRFVLAEMDSVELLEKIKHV